MAMEEVLAFLEQHKTGRIALACHQRPDGDALGSTLGLAGVLRSLGRDASLVNPSLIPPNLEFMIDRDLIHSDARPDWYKDFDCIGVLDCGELGRVEEANQEAVNNLPAFTIDHHVSSHGLGRAVWIDPGASSTGEMVVRLCRAANWPLPRRAAMALWTAIVTDTGRFSYENTSAEALEAARECLVAGADPSLAATNVYQSVTMAERRLQTLVLERMEFHEQGRLALSWLLRNDFAEAGVGVEGTQDLINLLRDTAGVEVSVFLCEMLGDSPAAAGMVKASMRTVSPYNAIEVVKRFGGGGHMRAAGCSLKAGMDEAREKLLAAAKAAFFG